MKKFNFFFLFLISTVCLLLLSAFLNLLFPALEVYKIWTIFYILLFSIGVTLLIRGIALKIDSALFIAVLIISCCIIGIVVIYSPFGYAHVWPFYILGLFFANITIRLVFFDRLQGLLAFISIGIFVNSLLFNLNLYALLWYIVINVVWCILCVFGYNAKYNK